MDTTLRTPFYDLHIKLGAKMMPFGGYMMPIQYEGIFKEHFYTRDHASLFDTCHMGEFMIEGPTAVADLEKVLSCPVADLKANQCRYGFICNENGGVIDDQIIYRFSETKFMMVVNASTQLNDFIWIKSNASSTTSLINISEQTAKIDLQGPETPKILKKLVSDDFGSLKYYYSMPGTYKNTKLLISRTGYTGEIGFEIYCDIPTAHSFWNDCMELGAKPAGLGCRDTLRLEMGYPLYGHELDETRNAAESGFAKAIATDKAFIGSKIVTDKSKAKQLLCPIVLDGRRAARNGDQIFSPDGKKIGLVTSGCFAPSVEKAIALGYIDVDFSKTGTQIVIKGEKSELPSSVSELPFFKGATARKTMKEYV